MPDEEFEEALKQAEEQYDAEEARAILESLPEIPRSGNVAISIPKKKD